MPSFVLQCLDAVTFMDQSRRRIAEVLGESRKALYLFFLGGCTIKISNFASASTDIGFSHVVTSMRAHCWTS